MSATEVDNKPSTEEVEFKAPALPKVESQVKQEIADPTKDFLYTAPSWQCEPSKEDGFYIDVIKNGIVAEKIELHSLKNGSFLCIGRFPPSDIQLEHPSVSRYHCILQYGKLVDDPNWYIYDLG